MKGSATLFIVLLLALLDPGQMVSHGIVEALQDEREVIAPVPLGAMSERQRQHSKLYHRYSRNRNIPELLKSTTGDLELYHLPPLGADLSGAPPITTYQLLRERICSVDTVIVGTVKGKSSQLTEDQSFVFTDYTISVEEVLKSAGTLTTQQMEGITVSMPGGAALINNRKVTALDEAIPPLKSDRKYVLLLRFIPGTQSYIADEPGTSFELSHGKVSALSKQTYGQVASEYSAASFVSEIRHITSNACQ